MKRAVSLRTPEIRRSDLAAVLLQSLVLRSGRSMSSRCSIRQLRCDSRCEKTLRELDAIDARGELTKIGRQLGALPCDPRVGRMLIEANERNCLHEVLIIAAALESQDPRQRPAGQAPAADEAHAMFLDPHSDFLSYLRLWDFYERLGVIWDDRVCKRLFTNVSYRTTTSASGLTLCDS